jgi:large subunit ribosomal protein L9
MGQVQLILSEDVHALGDAGDLVSVKPGYARNYLLAKGKAILATAAKVKEFEHKNRVITEKLAKELKDLEAVKIKLEGIELSFEAKAGEDGKLFGSVTAQQIADQLAAKGVEVDRRKIALSEPIKSVGDHDVKLKLRGDLVASLQVKVEAASE